MSCGRASCRSTPGPASSPGTHKKDMLNKENTESTELVLLVEASVSSPGSSSNDVILDDVTLHLYRQIYRWSRLCIIQRLGGWCTVDCV